MHKLLCDGPLGLGGRVRAKTDAKPLESKTLVNFIRIGWGQENAAFCQFFTNLFIPDGTARQHRWWGDLERETASPEVAARLLYEMQGIDVLDLASRLNLPTLILHCRGDMRVPFEEGCKFTAAIPNTRFVPLESRNHVLLPEEQAWGVMHRELASFLEQGELAKWHVQGGTHLTPAEHAVLDLLVQGLSNRMIAHKLGKSEKTVRNQLSIIFDKLGVESRAQAIVMTLEH